MLHTVAICVCKVTFTTSLLWLSNSTHIAWRSCFPEQLRHDGICLMAFPSKKTMWARRGDTKCCIGWGPVTCSKGTKSEQVLRRIALVSRTVGHTRTHTHSRTHAHTHTHTHTHTHEHWNICCRKLHVTRQIDWNEDNLLTPLFNAHRNGIAKISQQHSHFTIVSQKCVRSRIDLKRWHKTQRLREAV